MTQPVAASAPRLPLPEFIALMAMLFATIAFSIDAMLPALPEIAAELSPDAPNKAQLILTSFVLGMGIGTFITGPLSDSFGRRRMILAGSALYCVGAAIAWAAPTLEGVLIGRLVQGLGAAGPRIVAVAMVRDLYAGRQMARIMSFAMMIFTLVPAVAPLIGTWIIALGGWRGIFPAFILFSALSVLWLVIRQPETLPPAARSPLRAAPLIAAAREVMGHRVVQVSIAMQAMLFAALFGTLSQIQFLFDQTFGHGDTFPYWFAGIALASGSASLMNAQLVMRLGMRRMVRVALLAQVVVSGGVAAVTLGGLLPGAAGFPLFLLWVCGVFFMTGFTLGNINAIAMEPLGRVAGMAASLISALATVAGVALAVPLGLAFDGTIGPLALGVAALAGLAVLFQTALPPQER
ncbi:MFS transporter, DHA1 family, bicyclomycin/chloramphenicol resistance protein [Gemmobacter megaterium]|uniref:MFS transporter, DHA1 family, bicyclomycin/chloramphenicol resistance protein n=1 Tax=Gemmobacter megaterium TaxID=1086013 RepID=A0A1N7P1B5_9RHOB|nr:multidrug effflux MFS transporter [Gemmobacter megaterium]GGE15181.1 MFS transporter [Gemmobacter megaterium]SIT04351.1 MFS transporter, DHA1 family, bicyclomycin/chloramphenicol resistance protein [Gemmobacter megaterium]